MKIAVDLDKTLYAFPEFFAKLFECMQSTGNQIGVLTAEDDPVENITNTLDKAGIKPDFIIQRPENLQDFPIGIFKGEVCKRLDIDVLYDDFESSDPKIISDFFLANSKTIPFTSWGYNNKISHK
jgi:hypothetical protein